jgi:rubrerythrin
LFVLQVVLEGWGLSHYRHLAKTCQDAELARVLSSFLQDESRHHATGVALFNQKMLSAASRVAIIEIMALFLQMIQVGPQRLIAAIEQVLGHLSRQQKIRILEELDTETHSGSRLSQLRGLIEQEATGIITQELEERGYFKPLPADQCV